MALCSFLGACAFYYVFTTTLLLVPPVPLLRMMGLSDEGHWCVRQHVPGDNCPVTLSKMLAQRELTLRFLVDPTLGPAQDHECSAATGPGSGKFKA